MSAWTYLLNQAVVIVDYLRLTVWPSNLVVFYGWPEMLSLGDVLPQAVVVVALLARHRRGAGRRRRALGYLGAWFFVTLAPTSSVVPIATEVGAERRMYLPLMALAVLAVVAADALAARARGHAALARVAAGVALAAVVVALGSATVRRNAEYASPIALAQTVVERRPTAVAHHILGEQLGAGRPDGRGRGGAAHAPSRSATRARGISSAALLHGRAARRRGGRTARGLRRHRGRAAAAALARSAAARRAHRAAACWRGSTRCRRALGRRGRAGPAVLAVVPRHPEAQRLLGAALFNTQQWPEADRDAARVPRHAARRRPGAHQPRRGARRRRDGWTRPSPSSGAPTETDPADPEARRLLDLALADQQALRR